MRHRSQVFRVIHRAAGFGLPAGLTPEDWLLACETAEERCVYCGWEQPDEGAIRSDTLHIDLYIPPEHGGGAELGNVVPACSRCTGLKRVGDPYDSETWKSLPRGAQKRAESFLAHFGGPLEPGETETIHHRSGLFDTACGVGGIVSDREQSVTCKDCNRIHRNGSK